MRVSPIVFVARAVTLRFVFVVDCVVVRVAVFVDEFFGVKIVIGFVVRAVTFVRNGVRDVIVRVARAVVFADVLFARDTVFAPRSAAPASDMQSKNAQTKSKNFFISREILANL